MKEQELKKQMKEAEDFLCEIPKFTKKNPPVHTRMLMHALGDPQEKLRILHVAGSNGKGSVCSFLFHILKEKGCSVGLFISPHLVDIRERFQTNEGMCRRSDFLRAFSCVRREADRMREAGEAYPTYFEFLYAMGMLIFDRAHVDYAVVETGLGGRLDCTNVVKKPLITIITSISLEHTEYLGSTIPEIAAEKAGILKKGVPAVIDAGEPEAEKVIKVRAQKLHVPVCAIHRKDLEDIRITPEGVAFTLYTKYDRGTRWKIPFFGLYQAANAALAITACRVLTEHARQEEEHAASKEKKQEDSILQITDEQIREGLLKTSWPGRMQEVQKNVFFDGAHNPDGIRVFLDSVQKICVGTDKKPLLLFSMVRDKDYEKSVRELCEGEDWARVIVTHIPSERGLDPDTLLQCFHEYRKEDTEAVEDYKAALDKILALKADGQKLFCTGSLYFIGALLEYLHKDREKKDV